MDYVKTGGRMNQDRITFLDALIILTALTLLSWLLFAYAIPKQLAFNNEMAHRSRLASVEAPHERR